ncbi:YchJ family protein [Alkanindiges sp. WGS2144]|uniref:YchJ family protein n=1 Tax=Alkanindiges sp. WGS2144 TaxID=3366808 RepID=UPI003751ADE9
MQVCPCGSNQSFAQCCQLLHLGVPAHSAEQLMRSRYSAYVVGNIEYIINTTVSAQQGLLDMAAIRDWSTQNQWLGLSIVSVQPALKPQHAKVECIARFRDHSGEQHHHEHSSFVRIAGRWYFLDPTVACSLSLKSPCLCGSGQKFKRCCAFFLAKV